MATPDLLYLIASLVIPALLFYDYRQREKQQRPALVRTKQQERIALLFMLPLALLPLLFLFGEMLSPGLGREMSGNVAVVLKWVVIIAAFGWLGSRVVGVMKG